MVPWVWWYHINLTKWANFGGYTLYTYSVQKTACTNYLTTPMVMSSEQETMWPDSEAKATLWMAPEWCASTAVSRRHLNRCEHSYRWILPS